MEFELTERLFCFIIDKNKRENTLISKRHKLQEHLKHCRHIPLICLPVLCQCFVNAVLGEYSCFGDIPSLKFLYEQSYREI